LVLFAESITKPHYLLSVAHKDAKNWVKENVPESLHSKKRKLYKKSKIKKVPKSATRVTHAERPYERAIAV